MLDSSSFEVFTINAPGTVTPGESVRGILYMKVECINVNRFEMRKDKPG